MTPEVAFLWEVLKYQESRIGMVDSKASLVIAVETGLFALVAFVVEKAGLLRAGRWDGLVTIAVSAAFTGLVILLLLQTIRPTRWIFGHEVAPTRLQQSTLLWPSVPPTADEFAKTLGNPTPEIQATALRQEVFVHFELLIRKYAPYRAALQLAKLQILVTFTTLAVLTLCHLYGF
jgi:hypothetical protein